MSDVSNLTEEQKQFLEECEIEFSNRFTEEDEEYMKTFKEGISNPPIIYPWYGRPRLSSYRSRYRNYQNNRFDRGERDRYHPYEQNSRYERQRNENNLYRH